MKTGLLAISLCLVLFACQTFGIVDDQRFIHDVQMPKEDIFTNVIEWVAVTYVSPKTVLEYYDKDAGKIIVRARSELAPEAAAAAESVSYALGVSPTASSTELEYKIIVDVKDGGFRVWFTNISPIPETVLEKAGSHLQSLDQSLTAYVSSKLEDSF